MAKLEVQTCDYQLYWGHLTHMDSLQAHPEVNMTFNNDISGMANKLVIGGEYRYHDYDVNRYTASSFDEVKAVGDGSGNPGSESLYPISGFNTVIGMNVTF